MAKKIFVICMVLAVFAGAFAGCMMSAHSPYGDVNNPVVDSECGYFEVQLRREDGYAVVLELTDLGKEQEILVIPDEVQGLPVKQVGWHMGSAQHGIRSEKLKKIYIPFSVVTVANHGIEVYEESIFLPTQYEIDIYDDELLFKLGGVIFVTDELFQFLGGNIYDYWKVRLKTPNLIYYYNYDGAPNLGYFWFDNITGDNLFVDPDEPIREGYDFTGWFIDEDCETEWDGEKPQSVDEKITLYAGWEEI